MLGSTLGHSFGRIRVNFSIGAQETKLLQLYKNSKITIKF